MGILLDSALFEEPRPDERIFQHMNGFYPLMGLVFNLIDTHVCMLLCCLGMKL